MPSGFRIYANYAVDAVAILATVTIFAANVAAAAPGDAMPVTQQNAIVQKYCAVCHTDAIPNGGLSLQHFDAAHADPGLAAMIASKLRGQALGASGQSLPDRATQDALLSAVSAEGMGANRWVVDRTQDAAPLLTASIVQEVPTSRGAGDPDLYRLILTCRTDTREGGVLLTWSPGVPKNGQAMSVAADGKALATYTLEGHEKMGNGQAGTSGPGAVVLYAAKDRTEGMPATMPLPERTLTVDSLFPNETVVFPFDGLSKTERQSISPCFNAGH
jgi:hypothetical protein